MTDQITLNADLRERTGTNKAREIRNIDVVMKLCSILDKIKSKNNDDPLKIFNTAISLMKMILKLLIQ